MSLRAPSREAKSLILPLKNNYHLRTLGKNKKFCWISECDSDLKAFYVWDFFKIHLLAYLYTEVKPIHLQFVPAFGHYKMFGHSARFILLLNSKTLHCHNQHPH